VNGQYRYMHAYLPIQLDLNVQDSYVHVTFLHEISPWHTYTYITCMHEVYTHTCIRISVIHPHARTRMNALKKLHTACIYIHTYACMCMHQMHHRYMHIYILDAYIHRYTYIHPCISTRIGIRIRIPTYVHIHIYPRMYVYLPDVRICILDTCIICASRHVHTYIQKRTHTYMHACIRPCTHTCMSTRMGIRIRIHTYAYTGIYSRIMCMHQMYEYAS
jgi:hypothetical protein